MILTSVLCIHSYLQFTQILQSSFSRQPVHNPQYDRFVVCFFGFLGSLAPSCGLARFLPWPAYSERVVLLNLSWVILALLHLVGGRGRSRPVPPSHHEKCVARFWEISRSESQKWANCTNLLNYLQFMKSTSLQNIDRYPQMLRHKNWDRSNSPALSSITASSTWFSVQCRSQATCSYIATPTQQHGENVTERC